MAFLRKNYAVGKLASGISDVAIEVTLQVGHTLPTEAGEFRLTVWNDTVYPNPADDSGVEIMTAEYSGVLNVYDIVRAQEDTFASAHSTGHAAALHYTAGMSEDDLLHLPNHNHAAGAIISGVLIHERGGLEVDVHAYDGLVKISGGVTSEVIDNSSNWNTAFGWGDHSGLYDLAGTMTTHLGNFTHSDIALNTTHRSSDGSDHTYIDQDVTQLSYPLFINVNTALSSMIMTGGEISEGSNVGTIKVAALTAMLRTGAGATDPLVKITLAEQDNITLATADVWYKLRLTYGSPCTIATSVDSGNGANIIGIGHCLKEDDDTMHYSSAGLRLADGVRKLHNRASTLREIEISFGGLVSDPDTRHLYITAGVFYRGINRYKTSVKDTSTADSFVDSFNYYYWNPDGSVWVKDTNGDDGYIQIDNVQYNKVDSGTGLANLTSNKYTTNWVFMHPDDEHILVLYGRSYSTLTAAENEEIPASLPDILDEMAVLLCKIVIQQGSDDLIFENVKYFTFTPNITVDHNELQGLQGGQAGEYYHLTSAESTKAVDILGTDATGVELTELTDGSETTLHSHAVAFTDLTDTPNSYASADIGKILQVKDNLSGLEFTDSPEFADIITAGPYADVRAYGAVGDDVADDTSAIQDAFDAAIANGYSILIPSGTYKITSTLTLGDADYTFGVGIVGLGLPTLNWAGSGEDTILHIKNIDTTKFSNFCIHGNSIADTTGIHLEATAGKGCKRIIFENAMVIYCPIYGVQISQDVAGGVLDYIQFNMCSISYNGINIVVKPGVREVEITNGSILNADTYNIELDDGQLQGFGAFFAGAGTADIHLNGEYSRFKLYGCASESKCILVTGAAGETGANDLGANILSGFTQDCGDANLPDSQVANYNMDMPLILEGCKFQHNFNIGDNSGDVISTSTLFYPTGEFTGETSKIIRVEESVQTFTDLTDTPISIDSANIGDFIRVSDSLDLEFVDLASEALTVGSLITGGNIGVVGDVDVLQLGVNSVSISGILSIDDGAGNTPLKLISTDSVVAMLMQDSGTTAALSIAMARYNDDLMLYSGNDGVGGGVSIERMRLYASGAILMRQPIFLQERAAALGNVAGRGQIWVKNTDPCELWFTDDAGTAVQLGNSGSGFSSRCSVYLSGDQTISNNSWTQIEFDSEDFDGDSEFNTSTHRFTPKVAGYYLVSLTATLEMMAVDEKFAIAIKKTGNFESYNVISGMLALNYGICTTKVVYLSTEDYIEGFVWHDYGNTRLLACERYFTFLSVHRLS